MIFSLRNDQVIAKSFLIDLDKKFWAIKFLNMPDRNLFLFFFLKNVCNKIF